AKWTATYFYEFNEDLGGGETLYYHYDTANAQDVGTEPTATFAVTDHCRVMALYTMPGPKRITLGYATGSDATMGGIEIEPIGKYYHAGVTVYCDLLDASDFTAVAKPANGYKFDGWYSSATPSSGALVSVAAQYTQTIETGSVNTLYAKFSQDTEAVYEWEGESVTKMAVWRSKRYVGTKPMNMTSARVYSDGYPVSMSVYSASSPDHPVLEGSAASIDVLDQDARRLPMRRPEKYVEIEVRSMETVAEVAVSTAMEGLVQ
ncbi:MAG: hypothetical protein RBS99_08425, partial [Rhodospirillales bacterium]|nr:hypothetical protein [Rhodospirillales bacterium]